MDKKNELRGLETRGSSGGTTNFLLISQGSVSNHSEVYQSKNNLDSSFRFKKQTTTKKKTMDNGCQWGKPIARFDSISIKLLFKLNLISTNLCWLSCEVV